MYSRCWLDLLLTYYCLNYIIVFMSTESLTSAINSTISDGFAVHRAFVSAERAASLRENYFKNACTSFVLSESDVRCEGVMQESTELRNAFAEAGFPDWRVNTTYFKRTGSGIRQHKDRREYRYASALLYLEGVTEMELTAGNQSDPCTLEILPGDLLLIRQAAYDMTMLELVYGHDHRTAHQVAKTSGVRSFVLFGYKTSGTYSYDLHTRQPISHPW